MGEFMLESAMKAQNWELAKGRLRAQVALSAANGVSLYRDAPEDRRWMALNDAVDAFIESVEDNGWQE